MERLSITLATARLFLMVTALGLSCHVYAAPIVNGRFETGDLFGWTWGSVSSHTIAIAYDGSPYDPIQGDYSALLVAMSQAPVPPYSCVTDIWNVHCPQPLPFAPANGSPLTYGYDFFTAPPGVQADTRGGVIGQDIVVDAGNVLTWDWQLFGEAPTFDVAWFFANNGSIQHTIIEGGSLPGPFFTSGSSEYVFPTSGLWTIYFGTGQREDTYIYSAMMVDNIRLRNVPGNAPEPATLALLGVGLAGLGFSRRKQ